MITRGFILMEVLIALVISSMLTGVLFFTMRQVTVGVRAVDDVIDVHSRALIATRQLAHDIAGSALVEQENLKKIFFSEQQDNNCHLLTFITNNPLQQWQNSAGTPHIVRVTYRLIPDKAKGKDKRYILTRQESPELTFDQQQSRDDKKKPRTYELIDAIVQFKISYTPRPKDDASPQQEKDQKKIHVWDSDSTLADGKKREHNQMLPAQVVVTLELADTMQVKHMFDYAIPILPDMTPLKAASADTVKTSTVNAQPRAPQ